MSIGTKPKVKYICRCMCGGTVVGVREFKQWWTWCLRCTPVVTIKYPTREAA